MPSCLNPKSSLCDGRCCTFCSQEESQGLRKGGNSAKGKGAKQRTMVPNLHPRQKVQTLNLGDFYRIRNQLV